MDLRHGRPGPGTGRRVVALATLAAALVLLVVAVHLGRARGPGGPGEGAGGVEPGARPAPGPTAVAVSRAAVVARIPQHPPLVIPVPMAELPRGGREVFPRFRLVGYSGGPGSSAFGRLGIGDIDARVREIERLGRKYDGDGREVLPVLELIVVVVQAAPGRDGLYRSRVDDAVIRHYLDAARRHRGLLLLNIQPGRADFLDEVRALEPWLREPDVGLALDPEWAVGPGQVPGRVFGHMTGREVHRVASWLQDFTVRERLPEKVLVVHRLIPKIVRGMEDIGPQPDVAIVMSADGIGPRASKEATWRRVVRDMPDHVHPGFKLFFEEDARGAGTLMTPPQVLALEPTPEYVLYE